MFAVIFCNHSVEDSNRNCILLHDNECLADDALRVTAPTELTVEKAVRGESHLSTSMIGRPVTKASDGPKCRT